MWTLILLFVAMGSVVNLLVANHHLRGLRGGYGKGIWAEGSPHMCDARERVVGAWGWFLFCSTILASHLIL